MSARGIFDAHFHIIDHAYPVVENNGFLPEQFGVPEYRARTESLGIVGGAVVSGSFQKFDQTYPVAALEQLGEGFVGVTQLPATVTDEDVVALSACGVRGIRFNVARGGSASAALMFGTDLPSTRAGRPFGDDDIDLLVAEVGEDDAEAVLRTNAERFDRVGDLR